jgi:hypothetical protein
MPDLINVKAVPITSLVKGVAGAGYLSHAINLYLRCKDTIAVSTFGSDKWPSVKCSSSLSQAKWMTAEMIVTYR